MAATSWEAVIKARLSSWYIPSVMKDQGDKTKELSVKRRGLTRVNRKDWVPSKHSRVCSEHFISGEFPIDQFLD